MTKYRFRPGDRVKPKEAGAFAFGIVNTAGFGKGSAWYKVEADGGDVFNCREDELELVRRCPTFEDNPNVKEMETLVWFTPGEKPGEDENCRLILRHNRSDEWIGRFDGENWETEITDGCFIKITPDMVYCWSAFYPPGEDEEDDGAEDWADGIGQTFSPD